LAGNVIDSVDVVEAATTETSGIALWFAAILAMLALVVALFIAFLVKFFLKGRKSVAPTGDQVDRDGRT
jgi:cell division protein FtsX